MFMPLARSEKITDIFAHNSSSEVTKFGSLQTFIQCFYKCHCSVVPQNGVSVSNRHRFKCESATGTERIHSFNKLGT